jgi:hypothetical protein
MPTPGKTPRHRFDIVAYDQLDKPILVVEIKRSGDIRSLNRLVEDTKQYVHAAAPRSPFFIIATPQKIDLYRPTAHDWELAYSFDAEETLGRYDPAYGRDPVYESYLASLVQVWLNDISYNWHSEAPPEAAVFARFDLLDALRDGSMAADAAL